MSQLALATKALSEIAMKRVARKKLEDMKYLSVDWSGQMKLDLRKREEQESGGSTDKHTRLIIP